MSIYIDQLGREVEIFGKPQRIVSLVPSQTELLYSLGLSDRIVGRTRFCIHPRKEIKETTIIGGTKDFSVERIKQLNPDLIIANKEENDRERIKILELEFPVYITDVADLPDALVMIRSLGELTGTVEKATIICDTIHQSFAGLKPDSKKKALYFIWKNPWMVAGRNTFINDMMHRAGFINLALSDRYPELTNEQLFGLEPEVVLLSSEPYPFREKHIEEIREMFPSAEIMLVNGEYFSWYGSRLMAAVPYFESLA